MCQELLVRHQVVDQGKVQVVVTHAVLIPESCGFSALKHWVPRSSKFHDTTRLLEQALALT